MTRILGIDPGSQRTGIGIIDIDERGASTHVFHAAVQLLGNDTFPLRLKQILQNVQSRTALVCMFLALLELVRLQAIQLRQDRLFGEILLRKHVGFDAVMTEQAAVRDDWR